MENPLITENINLVHFVVNKFINPMNQNYDDYFQIGCLGLVKAAAKYNESKGKFSTYAVTCIRNEILIYLRVKSSKQSVENTTSLDAFSEDNPLAADKLFAIVDTPEIDRLAFMKDIKRIINDAITTCSSERSRKILVDYFYNMVMGETPTGASLGKKYGVSRSEVCRLTKLYRERIREKLKEAGWHY